MSRERNRTFQAFVEDNAAGLEEATAKMKATWEAIEEEAKMADNTMYCTLAEALTATIAEVEAEQQKVQKRMLDAAMAEAPASTRAFYMARIGDHLNALNEYQHEPGLAARHLPAAGGDPAGDAANGIWPDGRA